MLEGALKEMLEVKSAADVALADTERKRLRDYFAGKALAGMLANDGMLERLRIAGGMYEHGFEGELAIAAYDYADAMLAAREVSE